MNSLSLLSSQVEKVIGATPPQTPRNESFKGLRHERQSSGLNSSIERSYVPARIADEAVFTENEDDEDEEGDMEDEEDEDEIAEQATLLYNQQRQSLGERIYLALLSPWLGVFRWIVSALTVSADWFISCIYDEQGIFSPLMPVRRVIALGLGPFGRTRDSVSGLSSSSKSQYWSSASDSPSFNEGKRIQHRPTNPGTISTSSNHHSRARSFSHNSNALLVEEINPQRTIRIRLYNEDSVVKSRSTVKSPTSPSSSLRLTKYPRNSGPPKPLLPNHPSPKTLILDLDETLIHSLAKGGRMSSGHMVEVKLDRQHAILYYVHKRPYCDDFLRKVLSNKPNHNVPF